VTRVVSGVALIAIAVGVVWFAPQPLFILVAEIVLILAFVEYARLAAANGLSIPAVPAGVATVLASIGMLADARNDVRLPLHDAFYAVGVPGPSYLDTLVLATFVSLAALTLPMWRGERDALGRAAASLFPMFYLGFPIGALIVIRQLHGREALFLLMLTVMVSDTAQYYSGRAFGQRLLAPVISPKKTIEGAIGGFVFGAVTLVVAGAWWLPNLHVAFRALLGVALVALGIAGDLFESMLKRSAGVKDSSAIIPGHGGVLDRIDALLFAAPVYYIVLKYA
jgi:phosphatidate cytidylyltransferase